ncbi:hypothetical protein ASG39_11100 [Rhizobium sp. Leaf371]|uniref:DUF2171 domain-containing protein n=1 Tax=unclassified Rhizobium TaxID=2613769 RepID=UPI0007134C6F|nr:MULTISPECIES: DUF2171 domain-containing protein [unclassified Rhizobium]KQS64497.1 hypothetical protein ASG39_11100 [Rhizobium sp. Leaf371]TCM48617.1 hypothetical protein C8J36_11319 [Rhizobium sp. PP-F2F-G48]
MINASHIKEHAEVISADGVHVGTVDGVEGDRIKLTKKDNPVGHQDHHHFIALSLVDSVDENRVRLSAKSDEAFLSEQEDDGGAIH